MRRRDHRRTLADVHGRRHRAKLVRNPLCLRQRRVADSSGRYSVVLGDIDERITGCITVRAVVGQPAAPDTALADTAVTALQIGDGQTQVIVDVQFRKQARAFARP